MAFLMLKANDTGNYNVRVNWYYRSALRPEAEYGDMLDEAQAICEARGWSLINIRPVPEDAALERIAAQQREGPGG